MNILILAKIALLIIIAILSNSSCFHDISIFKISNRLVMMQRIINSLSRDTIRNKKSTIRISITFMVRPRNNQKKYFDTGRSSPCDVLFNYFNVTT